MAESDTYDMDQHMGHNVTLSTEDMDLISNDGETQDLETGGVKTKKHTRRKGGKRSSRACGSCRSRKVRCNVVLHGIPCSNCEHDEVECIVPNKRRYVVLLPDNWRTPSDIFSEE